MEIRFSFWNNFYNLISKLEGRARLLVEIMVVSGRRAVDILRIKSTGVLVNENNFFITLDKDKKNSLPVSFTFNFHDPVITNQDESRLTLLNALQTDEEPFKDVSLQRIRRKANFRLHSLRNRKAILMILDGRDVDEIRMSLGWSDMRSLQRYLKLAPNAIRALNSYDKVLDTVRCSKVEK